MDLKERFFNVHTIKAIAAVLVSFGLLSSNQVDSIINSGGGDVTITVVGIAVYVVYALLRKDPPASA